MDIKINGSRFKNLLSYDWIKIIISIVAGIIVWSLLFSMLGTRLTTGQEFVFHVYENVHTVGSSNKNAEMLVDAKRKNLISYDVLKFSVNPITAGGQYSASYMLSLKMSTQEGDVMIISDGRAETEDKNKKSDLTKIVNNRYLCDMDTLLKSAREYCVNNGFVIENGSAWHVNEQKIEEYFLNTRIKGKGNGNYRKTYRTAQQKKEGVKLEIARIKKLYENYLYVSAAIQAGKDAGTDFLWYGDLYKYDENNNIIEDKTETRPYGIDLYKLNQPFLGQEGVPNVEDTWFTYANGKPTAEGLVICVFDFRGYQVDLQYETLGFLRYIIQTYGRYEVNV